MHKIAAILQYPAKVFSILLIFISQYAAGQNTKTYSDSLAKLHISFEKLRNIPVNNREDTVRNIYAPYRKADSASAMKKLDELTAFAQNLHDKGLESYVFDLKADYFAVNRGFNDLSTAYYQQAIDFAVKNNMPVEEGVHLHSKGLYYYNSKRNADACLYFLQAQEKFKQVGLDKVYGIANYLSQVADLYYNLGDYEMAKKYLLTALQYDIPKPRTRINLTNTIGLIYRNNKQYPQALEYFNAAHALPLKYKDSVWVGIALGNIGSLYFMQNDYDKALPYIVTDYRLSAKFNELQNASIALLRLVKINLDKNNLEEARRQLDTAATLTRDWPAYLNIAINMYDLNAQVYERMGQAAKGLEYREKYEMAKDSIARRDNIAAVDRVILKWETDKRQEQMDKLKADNEMEALKRNGVIAILVLLIIIFAQVYYRRLLKARKNQELLMLEKKRIDDELQNATIALQQFTDNLKRKNDLIETFKDEIDRLNVRTANTEDERYVEKLVQAHIMTDDSWNEFKKLFMKVHAGFLSNLKNKYPNLSETDIRMLALIRLRLNNREMAHMLGITMDGVKKGKQRLRKKMDLPVQTDIEEMIEGL